MSRTVLYMSMSVDGFIAGPNDGPGNGLGDGGHRLHEWFLTNATKVIGGSSAAWTACTARSWTRSCPQGRWSSADGPSSSPTAGAATTTTAS